ncbi:coronatine-insensitive 1 [Tanacetum coccineum]
MEKHPHESIYTVFNCVIPFPYLESLTLKGFPLAFENVQYIDLKPWIKEIVASFKCLKALDIRRVSVHDSDLELLARTRGKDLRVLKINNCKGFRGKGLMHIGRHCNDLRTLGLEDNKKNLKIWKWLHNLALNNTCIESLKFSSTVSEYGIKVLTLLAKNCSQSLVSLKMDKCNLSDLREVFNHAVNLKDFACCESEKVVQEDNVLQVIGQSCKKLRKLKTPDGLVVTHTGLIALAQGCLELEYLHINSSKNISTESLKCIGSHLKRLNDFHITLHSKSSVLDNGIGAMLIGCSKLKRLSIDPCGGQLTNDSLGYIGKYGHNLRYLSLGYIRDFEAGLVELSKGCPKLRKLEIKNCVFSKQSLSTLMNNIQSLRYMWVIDRYGHTLLAKTRHKWVLDCSERTLAKTCRFQL